MAMGSNGSVCLPMLLLLLLFVIVLGVFLQPELVHYLHYVAHFWTLYEWTERKTDRYTDGLFFFFWGLLWAMLCVCFHNCTFGFWQIWNVHKKLKNKTVKFWKFSKCLRKCIFTNCYCPFPAIATLQLRSLPTPTPSASPAFAMWIVLQIWQCSELHIICIKFKFVNISNDRFILFHFHSMIRTPNPALE